MKYIIYAIVAIFGNMFWNKFIDPRLDSRPIKKTFVRPKSEPRKKDWLEAKLSAWKKSRASD